MGAREIARRGVVRTVAVLLVVAPLAACRDAGSGGQDAGSTKGRTDGTAMTQEDRDRRAIRGLLDERAEALLEGDRAAFLATVNRRDRALVRAQGAYFDNLRDLGVRSLSYELRGKAGLVPLPVKGGGRAYRPDLQEGVRLAGDRAPVVNTVQYTFVKRRSAWLLGAEGFGSRGGVSLPQSRPWAPGRIAVTRRGAMTVVMDSGRAAELPGLADTLASELGSVASVLDRPADGALLVDATSNGQVSDINELDGGARAAAVTLPVFARGQKAPAGWRVKINPRLLDRVLGDTQTLRHELTHFVLRGTVVPTWLAEGIAEYAAWYPLGPDDLVVPQQLYDRLSTEAPRDEPPSSSTFDTFPEINYPVAFATVSELAARRGLSGVLGLLDSYRGHLRGYRGDDWTPRALRTRFGLTETELAEAAYQRLMTLQHAG